MPIFSGRRFQLHYATWGRPEGRPVLFFHGFPGSLVQARALEPLVGKHDLFLIAADRPGYGESRGRGSAADFLEDLGRLLDSLCVKRFSIIGVSGGAPWSHLMACRFSERVRSLGIVSGLATYNARSRAHFNDFQNRGLALRRRVPAVIAEWIVNRSMRAFDPERGMERFVKLLHASDQDVLGIAANRQLMTASMAAARTQGAKGIVFDSALYHRDWLGEECDREKLARIPTFYFHGQRDHILSHEMSEWMHREHGSSRLRSFPDEGHYSLALRHGDAILSEMAEAMTSESAAELPPKP